MLVPAQRESPSQMCIRDSPKIVQFWWAVDRAVMDAVTRKTTTKTHGIIFSARNGMLFITQMCIRDRPKIVHLS